MRHEEAMDCARRIANLILRGARNTGRTLVREQPLMAALSIMAAAEHKDVDAFDPAVQEIVLFGSTARGESDPSDIDLMLFDKGFYSNVLSFEPTEGMSSKTDWYHKLQENLKLLFEGWFGFTEDSLPEVRPILDETLVDLHVLPTAIFTNPVRREEIAAKHFDPRFFQNAFSSMQRFDPATHDFVPVDLGYFERKYNADLSGLH